MADIAREILGGRWSPIGWSVGWIEAPLLDFRRALVDWRRRIAQDRYEIEVCDHLAPWPDCLAALTPLSTPWNVELLVAHGDWTAYLNNGRNGSDLTGGALPVSAKDLGVRWVDTAHQPRTAVGHANTLFSVNGPSGQPPHMNLRTLQAHAGDGRWTWWALGDLQPYERTVNYTSRLIRDRLTRDLLTEYLAALGIRPDENDQYGMASSVTQHTASRGPDETLAQARVRWGLPSRP